VHEKGSKVVQFLSDTIIRNNVNIQLQVKAKLHDGKEILLATIQPEQEYAIPMSLTTFQGPLRYLTFRAGDDSYMLFSEKGQDVFKPPTAVLTL
jgi:hypothetical protein